MKRKVICCGQGICIKLVQLWIFYFLSFLSCVSYSSCSAVLVNANPVSVKRVLYSPYAIFKRNAPRYNIRASPDYDYMHDFPFTEEDAFQFEPSDAVDERKYSQPIADFPPSREYRGHKKFLSTSKVPPIYKDDFSSFFKITDIKKPSIESYDHVYKKQFPTTSGSKFFDSISHKDFVVTEATVTSDYKITERDNDLFFVKDLYSNSEKKRESVSSVSRTRLNRNNFTDTNDSHDVVPSDPVYSYYVPSTKVQNYTPASETSVVIEYKNNKSMNDNHSLKSMENVDHPDDLMFSDHDTTSSFDDSDIILKDAPDILITSTTTDNFTKYYSTTVSTADVQTKDLTTIAHSEVNSSNALPPPQGSANNKLSSGSIAGIVIAVLVCITGLTSAVIYFIYERYNGKCTNVVETKFNSDNCGYLDDSLRSSVYLNNHIELPKENSEEMNSLDNDSFLNSLETMTIQNYWADNTKNTKV